MKHTKEKSPQLDELGEQVKDLGQAKIYLRILMEVYNHHTEGIVVTDKQGNIQWINRAFTSITGYTKEDVKGKNPAVLKSGVHEPGYYKAMWQVILGGDSWTGEIVNKRKDGTIYPEWLSIHPICNDEGDIIYFTGILKDLTEKKKQEEYIKYLAQRDSVTHLYNKDYFIKKIGDSLNQSDGMDILLLDIGGLHRINESIGHEVGDKVLNLAALRLKECVYKEGIVARFGGCKFVIGLLSGGLKEKRDVILQKIIEAFNRPFMANGHEIYVTVNLGKATYPADGSDIHSLIQRAHIAMHRAIEDYGSQIETYTKDLREQVMESLVLEDGLRTALEKDQFTLNYQPIVDGITGNMAGVEALIRWHHPNLGKISPMKFIPIAERTGLIIDIGEWVVETACRQMKDWCDKGYCDLFVSVNISVRQLEQTVFPEIIERILRDTGVNPQKLELEITETVYMENIKRIIDGLKKIRALGVRLSIDDFGTGYSSLAQLGRLDISKLKIDRSFIKDINRDINNTKIVSAIISMAKSLNLSIVAEGVEEQEHFDFLRDNACDMLQGYFFGKPTTAEGLENQLKKQRL